MNLNENGIFHLHQSNAQPVANCFDLIRSELAEGKKLVVTIKDANEKRSQAQRRLQWMWYGQAGQQVGMKDSEIRDQMMRRFGVPIFYRDDINGTSNTIDVIRHLKAIGMRVEYEEMRDNFVKLITSNSFNVKQNNEYLNNIYHFWREQNIFLSVPEDLKHAKFEGEA